MKDVSELLPYPARHARELRAVALDDFEASAATRTAPNPHMPFPGGSKPDARAVAEVVFGKGPKRRGDQVGTVLGWKSRVARVEVDGLNASVPTLYPWHSVDERSGPMPAYLVMQITITDPKRWADYRDAVMPLIARFGGRHVSKADGVELLEGDDDDGRRIVMFEFPSVEAIKTFWASPEYQPVKDIRRGAGTLEAWAVPGA